MTAGRIYLLSIEQLYNSSYTLNLQDRVLQRLDAHRLDKVMHTGSEKAKCLAMGAGLLLQLSAYENQIGKYGASDSEKTVYGAPISLSVSEALERLEGQETPIQIAYSFGERGKPDFAEGDWHFNLSHSGEYVCCAVAGEEIGVDIQEMKPLRSLRIAERFFSAAEYERILGCGDDAERARIFYSIWVRKESYAKLTGEGIAAVVERDVYKESRVEWMEYSIPKGYCMALCRNKVLLNEDAIL